MTRSRFTTPAWRELLAEVAYYNGIEHGLGAQFAAAVEEAAARALAFPSIGSLASRNTRRMFVKRFPFALVYRREHDGIVIFAIAHHSRHPEYWLSRVQERAATYDVQPADAA